MITDKAFMGEEINWKKFSLLLIQKIWMIVITGVAGAVIGSSLYLLINVVFAGPLQYQVEGGFYIEFAEGILDAHDYYNAYTWNSVVHQDKIMDIVKERLTELDMDADRARAELSIQADILSDVRYLTLTVKNEDAQYAMALFDACEDALIQFGQEMKEFDAISLTHKSSPNAIVFPMLTWRAGVIGGMCGIILAFLVFMLIYSLNDSIYLQEEMQERFQLFSYGVVLKESFKSQLDKKWDEYCKRELKNNIRYRIKDQEAAFIIVEDICRQGHQVPELIDVPLVPMAMPQSDIEFEMIRKKTGVILGIPYASGNGRLVKKYIDDLQKQDCPVLGAILIEADAGFLRKYYQTYLGKRKANEQ